MENVDRHVLAGFCCVDAITSNSVVDPLSVIAAPLSLRRGASGIFAVMDAPGIDRSKTQTLIPDPASWPGPTSYEITIQDPSLRYLARRATIKVPQPLPPTINRGDSTPAPTTSTTPVGAPAPLPPLTTPQKVVLYPSPAAPLTSFWAVIRASVVSKDVPAKTLAGAVVEASTDSNTAIGVTNPKGEALLAIPGLTLQLSSSGSGSVIEKTTTVTLNAWFDAALLGKPANWIANPDDILNNRSTMKAADKQTLQLAPGQTLFVTFAISLT
jgi:hypothetical protein